MLFLKNNKIVKNKYNGSNSFSNNLFEGSRCPCDLCCTPDYLILTATVSWVGGSQIVDGVWVLEPIEPYDITGWGTFISGYQGGAFWITCWNAGQFINGAPTFDRYKGLWMEYNHGQPISYAFFLYETYLCGDMCGEQTAQESSGGGNYIDMKFQIETVFL